VQRYELACKIQNIFLLFFVFSTIIGPSPSLRHYTAVFRAPRPAEKSHVRFFSGKASREKISREIFSRGASPENRRGAAV